MAPEALFDRKYTVKSDVYVSDLSSIGFTLFPHRHQSFATILMFFFGFRQENCGFVRCCSVQSFFYSALFDPQYTIKVVLYQCRLL